MDNTLDSKFISIGEFEDVQICFQLNSVISVDIYFKRKLSPVFKKIYLEGSFLTKKNQKRILNNPDKFFIKNKIKLTVDWKLLNFSNLYKIKKYQDKKNEIKKIVKVIFDPYISISNSLRSFHYYFPIKDPASDHFTDDKVYLREVVLLLEVIVFVSTGITNKQFLEEYVEKKRSNKFYNKKFEDHIIQSNIILYQDHMKSFYDLVDICLKEIPLFNHLIQFINQERELEVAV